MGNVDRQVLILSCAMRSFMMEYDIHTVLDFLTLLATVWVIYTLRIPLKDTYQEEQDSVQTYYVVRPSPAALIRQGHGILMTMKSACCGGQQHTWQHLCLQSCLSGESELA